MAKSTATRAPRNLKPEDIIAAEAATEAQKTAREANSASLSKAVQDVIGEYYEADKAVIGGKGRARNQVGKRLRRACRFGAQERTRRRNVQEHPDGRNRAFLRQRRDRDWS